MTNKNSVRIGGACAFWGDTLTSTPQLLESGRVDYLVYDYLAEVTLSIMAGQKMMDSTKGYAIDFERDTILPNIDLIHTKKVKIIANAGGVNPLSCGEHLQKTLLKIGSPLKVAVVTGDNILPMLNAIKSGAITSEQHNTPVPAMCLTLNAYTGYRTITEALALGADIIITGRVADSALTLGILMHEFQWKQNDFDKLAQGSLAGHLIECGTQATGGNFTDWQSINNYESIGFPIAECYTNGEFYIDKPTNTGGVVNFQTVAEQLVYEIGNPKEYLLPDVCCDWSQVFLKEKGEKVKVSGAQGRPPTGKIKIAGTYPDGYKTSTAFVVYGLNAVAKATLIAEKIKLKVNSIFENVQLSPFARYEYDILGAGATSLQQPLTDNRIAEVVLKINATHDNKKALVIFSKELAQASTSLAPGLCQLAGGRPKVHPMIRLFTCLVPADILEEKIHFNQETVFVEPLELSLTVFGDQSSKEAKPKSIHIDNDNQKWQPGTHVQLVDLCYARSGDKGDHANIGVVARSSEAWHILQKTLTAKVVENLFKKFLDKPESHVEGFLLPGIQALNFMLYNALGDGGFASLRVDSQGKGFAQLLLSEWIQIPN